ncbi:MAG: CAP domain-containing protein [Chloroflexi bacterium]|nr:CAP domain-containing protein [Chloroflexota bacterium]
MVTLKQIGYSVLVVLVLAIAIIPSAPGAAQTTTSRQDRAAMYEILGLLNEWRLSLGLTPFRLDDTLEAMAIYQATYLASMRNIPDGPDIHKGRGGEGVKERALFDQFNWPYYGRPEQMQIGEIAAVRTAQGAITFWKSSSPHRRTVTNPAYREIGIAAFKRGVGHIYVAVLGARPNVLPALADIENDKLYLTNELSGYAAQQQPWLHTADQVRLFDSEGRPLSDDWIAWQEMIDLPQDAGNKLYVLYTDGSAEALSEVDLTTDVVVLPGYEPPPDPLLALLPAATAAPTATPEPPRPEILLVYDGRSLTIINNARRSLDLYGLEVAGVQARLPLTWWLNAPGADENFELYAFPPGDCVQAWSFTETSAPRKPAECKVRRAARSQLTREQFFWLEGTFDVLLDGTVVGTCEAAAKRCEVDLP